MCCKSQGQNLSDYFERQVDSLDRVQPISIQNMKSLEKTHVINVKDQQQFESLNEWIKSAIDNGYKNILIQISPGTFRFHENHISLGKIDKSDVSITIKGWNAIITSDEDYGEDRYCITPWKELKQADSQIKVVDVKTKLCMIPYKNTLDINNAGIYGKVQITQWFKAPTYQIEYINEDGVFFIASDLEYTGRFSRKGYNVNYDYLIAGTLPRFRLYDKRRERKCSASCFLNVSNSSLRTINLQGINFKGNKEGASLIIMSSLKALQVVIQHCLFDHIRGKVAGFSYTDNVVFDNNEITNTAGNELSFVNGSKNVRVTNNKFANCGIGLSNTMCVRCNESEYYIADNTFCNFGYGAIGVGLWHGHEKKNVTSGIIEHNEIYFSSDYFTHREEYTLMDAGAIYVWTQNDNAIIRYNYVHDYGGMGYYSGIYCDDGASNCKIYGNVILNTPDGYSISSRRVKDIKESFKNNENNFMAYNVIDGQVIFSGYGTEERHCQKGKNYVLLHDGQKLKEEMRYEALELNEKDEIVDEKWVRRELKFWVRN